MSGGIFDGSPIIEGGTDGTIIGNVGDRLRVESVCSITTDLNLNRVYSIASQVNMTSDNTNNNIFLFKNTSLTKTIYIQSIYTGSELKDNSPVFRLWDSPTITTNGTLQTSVARFIGNGAPSAEGLGYTLPTIANRGTSFAVYVGLQNTNSFSVIDQDLALAPGTSILLTGKPSSNNRQAVITISWVES